MASKNDDTQFKNEDELISFAEGRVKQLNQELDDLQRARESEGEDAFEKRRKHISREIDQLQGIIKRNYIRFIGGEQNIANWDDMEVYSWTIGLQERLSEIEDTG
jgi:hypothetical protein